MPRLTISEPNKAPQPYRFSLDYKLISIGQAPTNNIIISNPSVSSEHCVIERIMGGYIVRDNGSTNGIKLNGEVVKIGDLSNNSTVLIGNIPLNFQLSEEEATGLTQDASPTPPKKEEPVAAPIGITALPEAEEVDQAQELPTLPQRTVRPTAPAANRQAISRPSLAAPTSSMGAGTVIMLGVFGVAVGMCIRHQLDTGSFLPTELLLKFTA